MSGSGGDTTRKENTLMRDSARWAHVITSDATGEPVELANPDLMEAVQDALPTGYAVERLWIEPGPPALNARGVVDAIKRNLPDA
jgi:hypothetical protein